MKIKKRGMLSKKRVPVIKELSFEINFTNRKKTYQEKWVDLTNKYKDRSFSENKHGERVFSQRKFFNNIAKGFKAEYRKSFSVPSIKKMFYGVFTDAQKKFIDRIHTFGKLVKHSPFWFVHTYTLDNFKKVFWKNRKDFKVKKNWKTVYKAGIRVFYRATKGHTGVWLTWTSKEKNKFIITEKQLDKTSIEVYIVPNTPLPTQPQPYEIKDGGKLTFKKTFEIFFDEGKEFIDSHIKSIIGFQFNYFVVDVVNIKTV